MPGAEEGVAYSQQLQESGGVTPYTWSSSGAPTWLTVSASGQLAGTPPAGSSQTSPYTFTVTVTDSLQAKLNLKIKIEYAAKRLESRGGGK